MAAKFEYISTLRREPAPGPNDEYWSVDVKNTGDVAGVCTAIFYERMQIPQGEQWSGFSARGSYAETIEPGLATTFIHLATLGPYVYQGMVKSEAGTLLNPTSPKEFLCSCCLWTTGKYTSYDTQEELEAHYQTAHSEYLAMPHLHEFWVEGLSWPTHFTKYGEDYGKIISWKPICLLDEDDYEPDAGWWREYRPVSGSADLDTSEKAHFIMPDDWNGAWRGPCGLIPNSTTIRLFFRTDQGWSGFLGDSPQLLRINSGSTVQFKCYDSGPGAWEIVQAPEEEFSEFSIVSLEKLPPGVLGGSILEITWYDGVVWHDITYPMPHDETFTHCYRIKNTGTAVAEFKIGIYHTGGPFGDYWSYSPAITLSPGQDGNIYWDLWSGPVTVVDIDFHLFANEQEVEKVTKTITVV